MEGYTSLFAQTNDDGIVRPISETSSQRSTHMVIIDMNIVDHNIADSIRLHSAIGDLMLRVPSEISHSIP